MLRKNLLTCLLSLILSIGATGQITIQIDQIESCDSPVVVPVIIQDDITLISLQFTVVWDQPELSLNGTQNLFTTTGVQFGASTDSLSFAWYQASGYTFTAGETLFEMVFDVSGTAGSTYDVAYCLTGDCITPLEAAAPGFIPVPVTPIDGSITVSSDLPTIICPDNITVNNDSGDCGAIVTWATPSVADCDNNTTQTPTSIPASGSFFPIGTTTVTVNVQDNSGNPASCTFDVIVNDTEAPVLTCPTPVINLSVPTGTSSINVNDVGLVPTTNDNCPNPSLSYVLSGATTGSGTGDANGQSFNLGSTTVTYTLSDGTNSDQCTVIVNITEQAQGAITVEIVGETLDCGDNFATVQIVVQNDIELISAQFNINWSAPELVYNSVSNVLFPSGVLFGPNSSEPYAAGNLLTFTWFSSTSVMLNAGDVLFEMNFDVTGNPGDCFSLNFFETPTTPPPPIEFAAPGFIAVPANLINGDVCIGNSGPVTMICPVDVTVECGASTDPADTGNATASDDCGTQFTITHSDQSVAGCGNTQTITRTFSAMVGNTVAATCQQIITVQDITDPVFDNLPTAIQDISCGESLPIQEVITATDNCGAVTVVPSVDPFTIDECQGYSVTYRWTVTDACNNSDEVTVTFAVLPDNDDPVFDSTPLPLADISCGQDFPVQEVLTATDNCVAVTVVPSVDPFVENSCAGYSVTYRWTSTDACNNTAVETVTFNVIPDTEDPVFDSAPTPLADIICGQDFPVQETLTATDNCDQITVVPSVDTFTEDPCNGYQVTYRWTATDACNNVEVVTASFNVLPDNEDPIFDADPAPLANISCGQDFPIQETLTATDNCDQIVVVSSIDPFTEDPCNGYQVTYRWTAIDACNNSSMKTVSFSVLPDNDDPVFDSAPATLNDISCGQDLPVQEVLTATDNCDLITVVSSIDPFTEDPCNGYQITYRWSAADNCGNEAVLTQSFMVLPDNEDPIFTNNPAAIADITCGQNLPTQETLTASDNCDAVVVVVPSVDPFTPNPCNGYEITYRWTAEDNCGNDIVATQSFMVLPDNEDPIFTNMPAAIADINCGENLPTQEIISATDNCDQVTVFPTVDPFTADPCNGYQVTYRWTATDNCGNDAVATQSFMVLPDAGPPTFDSTPSVIADIQCGAALPIQETLTATDDCADVAVVASVDPFTENVCDGYSVTYRWTVTDDCNNSAEETITFNVLPDTTVPTFDSQPDNLPDLVCGEELPVQQILTISDNCSSAEVLASIDPFTVDECNGYTVTHRWIAIDDCNNEVEITRSFDVLPDNEAPTFTIPSDLTLNCNQDAFDLSITGDFADLADNCSSTPSISSSDVVDLDGCSGSGTVERTWIATDDCGNASTPLTQVITVLDNEAPAISCQDITVELDADGNASILAMDLVMSLTDNCDADISISISENSFSCSDIGENTIQVAATDDCGNTISCNATVLVNDVTPPSITCPDDIELNVVGNAGSAVANGISASAMDVCGGVVITYSTIGATTLSGSGDISGQSFNLGITQVTYTATDESGNTASCTFSVTVNGAVMIECPTNLSVPADNSICEATVNDINLNIISGGALVAEINHSYTGATTGMGTGDVSGTTFNLGITVVTYTVEDTDGNNIVCSFTVEVEDVIDPVLTCPNNQVLTADPGITELIVSDLDPTFNDLCSSVNVTYALTGATTGSGTGSASGLSYMLGTTNIEYTATDASGNSSTCTVSVTINSAGSLDLITCPNSENVENDNGVCGAVLNDIAPNLLVMSNEIASINFTITGATSATGNDDASGTLFSIGTSLVTYTATGTAGQIDQCSFEVTVSDTEMPTLTCPDNITRNTDSGNCSAIVNNIGATADDNCGIASLTYTISGATSASGNDDASGTLFSIGTSLVTYTATSNTGQTATCTFEVTISDSEMPNLACPNNITRNTDSGNCSAIVNNIGVTADDNCGIASLTYTITGATSASGNDNASGTAFLPGESTLTYTATDAAGNSISCSFTVIVTDNEAPSGLDCPANISIVVPENIPGMIVENISPGAAITDNCGSVIISYTLSGATTGTGIDDASGIFYNVGTTIVEYLVIDNNGNEVSCSFNILINDGSTFLSCPASPITQNNDPGDCGAIVNDIAPIINTNPSEFDAINFDITGASNTSGSDDASGIFFNVGTSTLTYSMMSDGILIDQCQIIIEIIDNELPAFDACPASVTLFAGEDCSQVYSWAPPNYTDNCGIDVLISPDFNPGDAFPVGVTEIGYAAIDNAGNIRMCTFEITVIDQAPPSISELSNIQVNNDPGTCGAMVSWTPPAALDNCDDFVNLTVSHSPGSFFPVGETTVIYTATDFYNNTSNSSFTVTVSDNEDPIILNCPPANLVLTPVGDCQVQATWDEITATDNCGILAFNINHPSGTIFTSNTTVTVTALDVNGNIVDCSFEIEVSDSMAPEFTFVPDDITLFATETDCNVNHTWPEPTANDNCGIASINSSAVNGSIFPVGKTTVIFTAIDGANNSSQDSFMVTVIDNIAPVFNCPAAIQVREDGYVVSDPNNIIASSEGISECDGVMLTLNTPSAQDNCEGTLTPVLLSGPDISQPLKPGFFEFIYQVSDDSGNSNSCTVMIEVLPLPSFDISIDANSGSCLGDIVELVPSLVIPNTDIDWNGPNLWTSNDISPLIVLGPNTVGEYVLTFTSANICKSFAFVTVGYDAEPSIAIVSNGPVCDGELNLNAMTGLDSPPVANWEWTGPCDFSATGNQVQLSDFTQDCAGDFTVTATTEAGCSNTETISVQALSLPQPALSSLCQTSLCLGESCTLIGTEYVQGDVTYLWESDEGLTLPLSTNSHILDIVAEMAGTFEVSYMVQIDGCQTESISLTIQVDGNPNAVDDFYEVQYEQMLPAIDVVGNDVASSTYVIQLVQPPSNGAITVNADGTFDYQPADGFSGEDQFTYQLCQECGDNGCDEATVRLNITFEGSCVIPTLITPNGDDVNDRLEILCLENDDFPDNQITISNQWGDVVYQAAPYSNNWDGTLDGEAGRDLPDGTYFFTFKESLNAEPVKGFITIFR